MRILVQKFGGTALENIERIKQATNTIRSGLNEGYAVVVVASAMGDATDTLLELSKPFDARKSKREMDLLLPKAGAQVMSTSSMEIAASKNVQLRVRSAFEMNDLGTLISRDPKASGFVGIACDKQQQIFSCKSADNLAELTKLQEFKSKAADYGIEPEVICRVGRKNSHKAYFSISNRHVHNAAEILKEVAEDLNLPFEYERSHAKVSLIAEGRNTNDIVNSSFSCLIHQRICPRFWSVESGIRVSVWIRNSELQEAAEVLHRTFVKEAVSVSA